MKTKIYTKLFLLLLILLSSGCANYSGYYRQPRVTTQTTYHTERYVDEAGKVRTVEVTDQTVKTEPPPESRYRPSYYSGRSYYPRNRSAYTICLFGCKKNSGHNDGGGNHRNNQNHRHH